MVDHYSKWVVVVPVKDLTARTTATTFYRDYVRHYGCPEAVLTDRGPAFKFFQELSKKLRTTAYHPQGNGLCEKVNQIFINMLRTASVTKQAEWPQLLDELVEIYNNTTHCSTGYSPYFLMFGRQGQLPKDCALGIQVPDVINPLPKTDWVLEHQRRMQEAQEIVDCRMKEAHRRQEENYNQRANATPLHIGDKVWLKKYHRTRKLDSLWETEPYTITANPYLESDVYEVKKPGMAPQTVHRNRIKLCTRKDLLKMSAPPQATTVYQPVPRVFSSEVPSLQSLMLTDRPIHTSGNFYTYLLIQNHFFRPSDFIQIYLVSKLEDINFGLQPSRTMFYSYSLTQRKVCLLWCGCSLSMAGFRDTRFILEKNNFVFERKTFHQLRGTAMGIPVPPYDNLYLSWWEETKNYVGKSHRQMRIWDHVCDKPNERDTSMAHHFVQHHQGSTEYLQFQATEHV
ncbi:LOW QUALITY PROTEIN: uncharacterized protein RB166_003262 [Leptodactylus fuscus]